jgi:hypothetical protein
MIDIGYCAAQRMVDTIILIVSLLRAASEEWNGIE